MLPEALKGSKAIAGCERRCNVTCACLLSTVVKVRSRSTGEEAPPGYCNLESSCVCGMKGSQGFLRNYGDLPAEQKTCIRDRADSAGKSRTFYCNTSCPLSTKPLMRLQGLQMHPYKVPRPKTDKLYDPKP